MKNLFSVFFFILAFATCCFSQNAGATLGAGGAVPNLGQSNGLISGNHRFESIPGNLEITYQEALLEYAKIKGSPFLHGGEITVDIISHEDSIYKNVTILYDMYNNEVMVKRKKGDDIILNQAYYKGFTYNNKGTIETYKRVHPTDSRYYQILFENKDFSFCKEIKTSVDDYTTHIPSDTGLKKTFVHRKKHLIVHRKTVLYGKLKNGGMVPKLPFKYRKLVPKLKKELKIKRISKEKDYIRLMEAFPEPKPIDQREEGEKGEN